jgi:hypothetical protein
MAAPTGEPLYITRFMTKYNYDKKRNIDNDSHYINNGSKFSINAAETPSNEDSSNSKLINKKRVERKTTNPLESLKTQKLIF